MRSIAVIYLWVGDKEDYVVIIIKKSTNMSQLIGVCDKMTISDEHDNTYENDLFYVIS